MKSAGGGKSSLWRGIALGAAMMYVFDPERGKARRAHARNRTLRAALRTRTVLGAAGRDFEHRLTGLQARAARLFRDAAPPANDRLTNRVRAALGRCVSNPHAVRVRVQQGQVVLSGPVLAREADALLAAVRMVPGVTDLVDQLDLHDEPGSIPGLQGTYRALGPQRHLARQSWTPAARAAAGAAAGMLLLAGARRQGLPRFACLLTGAALLTRTVTNRTLGEWTATRAERLPITVEKTIHIDAPPERVFELWEKYEKFPEFMSHVQHVRNFGDGRSHWIVDGPLGTTIEFDATLIDRVWPRLLAWTTDPGTVISHTGMVVLEPDRDGTRVTVRMAYSPPAGALGHTLASVLGSDPKHRLDDDLMRMKAFVETGAIPHDAARQVQEKRQAAQ